MKIIDIPGGQGSEAWHQHRREHFNGSDAPAMMGCSPYKTRAQLLRELHTGVSALVDDATQARFDNGHRFEALARPLGEAILGEDLYPIVKANGRLSASLDGQTLMGDVDWEHKSLNDELREILPSNGVGSEAVGEALPLLYRVQIAHQHHCGGAERTLFTASKWTQDGQLIEARHCWVARDEALIARVLAGWALIEQELATYTPPEAAPAVTAAPQEHLPSPSVAVTGSLAVVSNLQPFGVALRAFIERIPKKPSTDQEFADTEAACKRLKDAEERLQAAENGALASMADVEMMRRTVAEFRELARSTRLASEKLVKARKEQIREDEVQRGARALAEHVKALNDRLGGQYVVAAGSANFGHAIKGLKTLDSVRNAIDTELARCKIEASATADLIDANLRAMSTGSEGLCGLFPDMKALAFKHPDDLAAVIAQRVAARKASLEAERERIRAEEAEGARRRALLEQQEREEALARTQAQQNAPAEKGNVPLPAAAGAYASSAPQAAQGAPSGDEGTAAHAEERAAEPAVRPSPRVIDLIEPDPPGIDMLLVLEEAKAFTDFVAGAFTGMGHPRPGESWWQELHRRLLALQPLLQRAIDAEEA